MSMSKLVTITKAPADREVVQQTDGNADIHIEVEITDNPNDDTRLETDFSFDKVHARILNEESGEYITPLTKLKPVGERWGCDFPKVPCGGPYLLDLVSTDGRTGEGPLLGKRRRHFYVGDVFVIAGQSNAAGMGKGFMTEPSEPGIHVLRNLEYWDVASQPFNDFDYSKQSMFLAFAKVIKRRTGIPVGLIPAAMGAASISRWLKDEDGDLYQKLLNTLEKHNVKAKALLWYQGCAEVWSEGKTSDYFERFSRFVKFVREDIKKDMPVFTFQLNRQKIRETCDEDERQFGLLREAQRRAAKELDGVYILPAIDAAIMSDVIHNAKASNVMLGERLGLQVLQKLYGIGAGADAPDISSAFISGEKEITLKFANVSSFLYTFNSSPEKLPIKIKDSSGEVGLTDYRTLTDSIKLYTAREPEGRVFVSGQPGTDPGNIIIDYGTQIPMLCFNDFEVGLNGVELHMPEEGV